MKASKTFVEEIPQPTFGKGRVCAYPGCETVLSIYNPLPYCSAHEDAWFKEPCEYDSMGNRRCRECGKYRPPVQTYWVRDERMRDGLSPACRNCRKRLQRNASNMGHRGASEAFS